MCIADNTVLKEGAAQGWYILITRKGISLNPAIYTTKVMQQYVAKTTKYIADNASLHTVLPYIVSEVLCTLCV